MHARAHCIGFFRVFRAQASILPRASRKDYPEVSPPCTACFLRNTLQSAKLTAKDARATGLKISKFLLAHNAISSLGEYLFFPQGHLHELARLSENHLERPKTPKFAFHYVASCAPDRYRPPQTGAHASNKGPSRSLGSEETEQVEISLWGRLLHNCHIQVLGVGTRCFSVVYVTSRKIFPEYASALAHLHTLQHSKLVFLISHKLWYN